MLCVVCFTNVHLIPMPLQVQEFPDLYCDCFVCVCLCNRVDHILGKGQIPMDKKIRDKLHPDGDSLEGMSMLGRVCKVERQVKDH